MSNIMAIWPLTPLQEGLLFHALHDPEADEVHPQLWVLSVRGEFDLATLRRAAGSLLRRHAPLRAAFRARDRGAPVQVIVDHVEAPVEFVDLSDYPEPDREQRLDRFLTKEHRRKFDLGMPPLVRFIVVKLGHGDYRLALKTHHILLDGWSMPILFQELVTLYRQDGHDDLPPVVPYENFLASMAGRDTAKSLAAWRSVLSGARPCLITPQGTDPPTKPRQYVEEALPESQTEHLIRLARAHQITVNTVVRGMWGLLLGELLGRRDVLFGAVVAGRPPELTGVETMIGMFVNTIPVRVTWAEADRVVDVLAMLQKQQADLASHHQVRLVDLQHGVGNPPLFDSILAFQNYPIDKYADSSAETPHFSFAEARGGNPYPVTLIAVPGNRLRLVITYRPDRITADRVQDLLSRFRTRLTEFLADPAAPVCRGPRTPVEKLLCTVFSEVLGLERVGIDDSFFELGGNSIVVLQLVSRARRVGLRLIPRDVFERPTVAALAELTERRFDHSPGGAGR